MSNPSKAAPGSGSAEYGAETPGLAITGLTENNLKDLSITIPHDRFVAVTGVSGSGKTTLAFDTIYAEGGRRYIETFSPYTRQFLDRLHQPKLTTITNVRPSLALEQRNRSTNSRSTVGTSAEINDYLKIVWATLASTHCPSCGVEITRDSAGRIAERLLPVIERNPEYLAICFPVPLSGSATPQALAETLQSQGFIRYFSELTGTVRPLEQLSGEENGSAGGTAVQNGKKTGRKGKIKPAAPPGPLLILVDRIIVSDEEARRSLPSLISASVSQAYHLGKGHLVIAAIFGGRPAELLKFSDHLTCSRCSIEVPAPKPSVFTFNSPLGACPKCHGFGRTIEVDLRLCIPDPGRTIGQGAVACWNTPSTAGEFRKLKKFCSEENIPIDKPWGTLSKLVHEQIISGHGKFRGVLGWFRRLQRKLYRTHVRILLARYRSQFLCTSCGGTRLRADASLYRVAGRTLPDLWLEPIDKLVPFFQKLFEEHRTERHLETTIGEIVSRLTFLEQIGLGYLTLDRQTRTLSGGENQRVNLTSVLGSRLTNTTVVLDEPTIGLHPRDTWRLINTARNLRDRGCSVIVVEHDQDVIRAADHVIDLGPQSGEAGGEIVYQGDVAGLQDCKRSLTGRYLGASTGLPNPAESTLRAAASADRSARIGIRTKAPVQEEDRAITLTKARANNLKSIDVKIPLNRLVVLAGISGSGKSTLITDCLWNPYRQGAAALAALPPAERPVELIKGLENIDRIELIDQSAVGTTPRSNPGTYSGAWDIIRETLADTPQAIALGLGKSAFSFNVDGGRCPQCKGAGQERIEMQFLADTFVECDACGGSRFKEQVLSVRLGGKTVAEILHMSIGGVLNLFAEIGDEKRFRALDRVLKPMMLLGLDYLTIGQPLNEVSGGEAQRIKLSTYLTEKESQRCLFILDEPTTGLHPHNIASLLNVFQTLIASGHSLLVVEHNLDVIRAADWLLELGPEAGGAGGELVAAGHPADLAAGGKISSPTIDLLRGAITPPRIEAGPAKINGTPHRLHQHAAANKAISVIGARHHNLKNISVEVPHNRMVVVTGVSGSGKSSLAFDIIFSEGQRRYIDCLSPYARQYLTQLQRPDVDLVDTIPPTIAVSQKTAPPHGVSTIATTSEVYQFLRLLYSKVGVQHCPEHDLPITGASAESIAERIIELAGSERIFLFAPVVSGRKGYYNDLFQRSLRAEIDEARIDGEIVRLEPELRLERHKLHWISLLVASLNQPKKNPSLLQDAIRQCLFLGEGTIELVRGKKSGEPVVLSTERVCPECRRGFAELDPRDFSFRSSRGMCEKCAGHGMLTIGRGDSLPVLCTECGGSRVGAVARHVYIGGKTIGEVCNQTAEELLESLAKVKFDDRWQPVVRPIMRELRSRLEVICKVGLNYLNLNREASSISGGEAQRLRLARTIGSPLTGVCYVLDEPTIGLHPADQTELVALLHDLRDQGNSLVVVEHDERIIRAADHVIDIGPVGGANGGHVVFSGAVSGLVGAENSQTGAALRHRDRNGLARQTRVKKDTQFIQLTGASANTLRNVSAGFPLNCVTAVVGVSGSGKSSLVRGSLLPAIERGLAGKKIKKNDPFQTWTEISNHESIEKLLEIDQTPVGKTPASTPASFLGIFDEIRKVYALLPEARARGWTNSHFSFNSGKGRCAECGGRGTVKIPMSFLPDATTICESCNGLRYDKETLEIEFQNTSIGDLLKLTMDQARAIMANHRKIRRVLDVVHELGVGYLTLGQPTHTLSGGEAQRLKIARELGSPGGRPTLYLLDEPTVGLHMVDVERLIRVLQSLADHGNTVIVIEHDLDVIRSADYVIELGPGPGADGGRIIFSGTPAELVHSKKNTPTKPFLLEVEAALAADSRMDAGAAASGAAANGMVANL